MGKKSKKKHSVSSVKNVFFGAFFVLLTLAAFAFTLFYLSPHANQEAMFPRLSQVISLSNGFNNWTVAGTHTETGNTQTPAVFLNPSEVRSAQRFHDFAMDIARQPFKFLQQTFEEYSTVAMTIAANTPCNVLVFGCGSDSYIYYSANRMPGARTIFLEDIPVWIKKVRQQIDADSNLTDAIKESIELKLITYTTKAGEIGALSVEKNPSAFEQITAVRYDDSLDAMGMRVILVDAPLGFKHGRSQSMFAARKIARQSLLNFGLPFVHVFVHDSNRKKEAHFADVMFGSDNYVNLTRGYENELVRNKRMNDMRYYKLDQDWAETHDLKQLADYYGYQL